LVAERDAKAGLELEEAQAERLAAERPAGEAGLEHRSLLSR
jgi:hypothetical protein